MAVLFHGAGYELVAPIEVVLSEKKHSQLGKKKKKEPRILVKRKERKKKPMSPKRSQEYCVLISPLGPQEKAKRAL